MGDVIQITRSQFSIGEIIHHRLFDYRGVIVDVDRTFQASDDWYDAVAKSRPPKDKPWYHVLVHGSMQATYVAEQNLETGDNNSPIQHPMLDEYFVRYENGKYVRNQPIN